METSTEAVATRWFTRACVVALLVLASVTWATPAGASHSTLRARLQAASDAAVAAGIPGVVVYARNGPTAIAVASGSADLATNRPMERADRFRVGSVTKTFTATVIMQLVHEGRLRLSDTVEQHLPGLVRQGGAITYRELLSHTSGLADYFDNKRIFAPYAHGDLTHAWPHRTIVRISTADKRLFAPGAPGKFAYSNTGYYILGLTIERITGHSLASELERRIFKPLHLRSTSLPSANKPEGLYAHGYTSDFGKKQQDVSVVSPTVLWAAGGVISTPQEIASFYRALFQGRLLPVALVRQMQTRVVDIPQAQGRQSIGLGLFRVKLPCGISWGHGGDLPGYTTQTFSSPDGRRQAVIAINAGEEGAFTPAEQEAIGRLTLLAYCRR